jgi:hypothetical protein
MHRAERDRGSAGRDRLHFMASGAVGLVVAALLSGCTVSDGGGEPWSRTYVRSFDRVWRAALSVLEEEGYLVQEEDRKRGRIEAASSAHRRDLEIVLDLRVIETADSVRVDVQARPGLVDGQAALRRMDSTVLSLLLALDEGLSIAAPSDGDA